MKPLLSISSKFHYGNNARAGLQSKTTIEAIRRGERTSTLRFSNWQGFDRISDKLKSNELKPGSLIRFYSEDDEVIVEVTNITLFLKGSPYPLDQVSMTEGWSTSFLSRLFRENGSGVMISYTPLPEYIIDTDPLARFA